MVARGVYRWAGIPAREWLSAASVLILPTLVLDAFTSLFFARVFPQMDPDMSGAFGGWMLICCGDVIVADDDGIAVAPKNVKEEVFSLAARLRRDREEMLPLIKKLRSNTKAAEEQVKKGKTRRD